MRRSSGFAVNVRIQCLPITFIPTVLLKFTHRVFSLQMRLSRGFFKTVIQHLGFYLLFIVPSFLSKP